MGSQQQGLFQFRLDRRVRREASLLVRDVRRVLRRSPDRVATPQRESLTQTAAELEGAWKTADKAGMRTLLARLDDLAEEHLAFAKKSSARETGESIGIAIAVALLLRAFALEAFKIPSGSMIPTLEIGDRIFVDKISYGLRIPWTTKRLFHAKQPERGEVIVFMNPCTPERDFIKRVVALPGDTVEVRCDVVYINGKAIPNVFVAPRNQTCTFWEKREEVAIEPWLLKECSHYRETVAGKTYSTFHSEVRPEAEKARDSFTVYTDDSGDNDFPGHRLPFCRDNARVMPVGRIESEAGAEKEVDEDPCLPRRHYVVPAGHVFAMGDNRAHSSDSRDWGPVPIENIKGRALFIWWSSQREDFRKSIFGIADPRDRPDSRVAEWERIGKTVR